MKRWLALSVFLAFCVFLGVLFAGRAKLGTLVKSVINTYGPELIGTEVRVHRVGVSFFTGQVKIEGLFLGNPKGFESPHAAFMTSVLVDLDTSSLTTDTIVIERIEVIQPNIIYEKKIGTDNFKSILDRKQKASGTEGARDEEAGVQKATKLLIKELFIHDGTVTLSASVLEGSGVSVLLPEIRLENIGSDQGGLSAEEVTRIILTAVYKNATTPAVRAALSRQLEELGVQLEAVGLDLKKELKSMKERVKKLFK